MSILGIPAKPPDATRRTLQIVHIDLLDIRAQTVDVGSGHTVAKLFCSNYHGFDFALCPHFECPLSRIRKLCLQRLISCKIFRKPLKLIHTTHLMPPFTSHT